MPTAAIWGAGGIANTHLDALRSNGITVGGRRQPDGGRRPGHLRSGGEFPNGGAILPYCLLRRSSCSPYLHAAQPAL